MTNFELLLESKIHIYGVFFPFPEKNLLKLRDCFSGVGEEEDEEPDKVCLCLPWLELTGDLKRRYVSVSDGLWEES